jgi:hypothetical protein
LNLDSYDDEDIQIIPNPVQHSFRVSGTLPTDELTLVNAYGQVVLTTKLDADRVVLPGSIGNGLYYAEIRTAYGKTVRKVLVYN